MKRPNLSFLIELALDAGARIEAAGKVVKTVTEKASFSDLVTETDVATERFCIERIHAAFPDHKFHCEEIEKEPLTSAPTWVIDPIDGTTNFVHTHPDHCISIAYFEDRKPILAAVYVPNRKELYTAEAGKGSHMNAHTDTPIKLNVAPKRALCDSIVATGWMVGFLHKKLTTEAAREGQRKFRETIIGNGVGLMDAANDIRRTGSCAVDCCSVASGRVDGYAEIGVHTYDYGAGILLVTEAGGFVCDYKGNALESGSRHVIAASSQELAIEITKVVECSPISDSEF